MAVITIPTTATEQPTQQQNLTEQGDRTYSRAFKDAYDTCEAWLNALSNGDTLGERILKSANLSRANGDMGVITLNLAPSDTVTEGEGEEETEDQIALDETWTIKAVRNDMSLLAYCGKSPSEAHRPDIEAWLKEPDGTVAAQMEYTKPDGTTQTLSDASKMIAEKFLAGHDSVMRFYPMLTKKRTYSTEPATVYENLACIDTPTVSSIYEPDPPPAQGGGTAQSPAPGTRAKKVKAPGNINSIISGHQWLKCQDDVDQTQDGKFVRTESWIGAKNGEQQWDENFYGTTNRWPMPLQSGNQ